MEGEADFEFLVAVVHEVLEDLNGEDPVAATTCFRRQISTLVQFFHKGALKAYRNSRKR